MRPLDIVGIDEVGTGAIAGPAVVAAFQAPIDMEYPAFIKDSKKLSARQREKAYSWLLFQPDIWWDVIYTKMDSIINLDVAIGDLIDAALINHNLLSIVVDGNRPLLPRHQTIPFVSTKVKADALVKAVSAASILAKVTRDTYMANAHATHPVYGWDKNKGYATPQHLEALKLHAPCVEHRHHLPIIRKYIK